MCAKTARITHRIRVNPLASNVKVVDQVHPCGKWFLNTCAFLRNAFTICNQLFVIKTIALVKLRN